MGVLFVILGLIVALSLFDYFSSRTWQAVTSDERNDTVFESRNQSYGAYKIRRDYNLLVILITLGIGGAIAASYGVAKVFEQPVEAPPPVAKIDMKQFAGEEEKKDEKLEPLEEKIPETQKTLAFVPPKIVNKETDNEPPIQTDFKDVDAGKSTKEGGEFAEEKDVVIIEEKKEPEPEILDVVEEVAVFPGGMDALKVYLQKNIKYPDVALELGVKGKCYLKFVVSQSGNISNVKILKGVPGCEECDQEAVRVVKAMPDWAPAKNNGKTVNSYYTLPISFVVQ